MKDEELILFIMNKLELKYDYTIEQFYKYERRFSQFIFYSINQVIKDIWQFLSNQEKDYITSKLLSK